MDKVVGRARGGRVNEENRRNINSSEGTKGQGNYLYRKECGSTLLYLFSLPLVTLVTLVNYVRNFLHTYVYTQAKLLVYRYRMVGFGSIFHGMSLAMTWALRTNRTLVGKCVLSLYAVVCIHDTE